MLEAVAISCIKMVWQAFGCSAFKDMFFYSMDIFSNMISCGNPLDPGKWIWSNTIWLSFFRIHTRSNLVLASMRKWYQYLVKISSVSGTHRHIPLAGRVGLRMWLGWWALWCCHKLVALSFATAHLPSYS
jgi:hypothetical protein